MIFTIGVYFYSIKQLAGNQFSVIRVRNFDTIKQERETVGTIQELKEKYPELKNEHFRGVIL